MLSLNSYLNTRSQRLSWPGLFPCWVSICHTEVLLIILIFCRTYLVSKPIIPYYYTQLVGDAKDIPTLLAASNFAGMAVIGMGLQLIL
jgi:hypothetical protein